MFITDESPVGRSVGRSNLLSFLKTHYLFLTKFLNKTMHGQTTYTSERLGFEILHRFDRSADRPTGDSYHPGSNHHLTTTTTQVARPPRLPPRLHDHCMSMGRRYKKVHRAYRLTLCKSPELPSAHHLKLIFDEAFGLGYGFKYQRGV